MDTLTHTLVGVALSRAFFKKRVAFATTATVIAANLPDLDMIYSWPGIRIIEYHRGVLHSVWMLPVWAALVAWGLRWCARRWRKTVPGFGIVFLLGLAGVGSHLLLDWTNAYGIRFWAPVSQRWYALDLMPLWDPWMWLALGAILVVPMLLSLVAREVGGKASNPHRFSGALALVVLAVWIGFRNRQHGMALDLIATPAMVATYQGQIPLGWAALPQVSTPWEWRGVVDLPGQYVVADLTTGWREDQGTLALERRFVKPDPTAPILTAEASPSARIFLGFARFPWVEVDPEERHTQVRFTDLRFAQGAETPSVHVLDGLNLQGQVESQSFGWNY